MIDHGICKSCGAHIMWAPTEAGRTMPLDVKPVEGGNVLIVLGMARVIPKGSMPVAYVSHFATCPQAAKHRKAKPAP